MAVAFRSTATATVCIQLSAVMECDCCIEDTRAEEAAIKDGDNKAEDEKLIKLAQEVAMNSKDNQTKVSFSNLLQE